MKLRRALPTLPLAAALLVSTPLYADPLDPGSGVLEASYRSGFDHYQKDEEIEVGGWAAANHRVGEIGGWRTYLRRAREPMTESRDESGRDSGQSRGDIADQPPSDGVKR